MPTSSTSPPPSPLPPSDQVMDIAHWTPFDIEMDIAMDMENRVHRAYDAHQWHAPPSPKKKNLAMTFLLTTIPWIMEHTVCENPKQGCPDVLKC